MNSAYNEGLIVETGFGKRHRVIQYSCPHILIKSNKELHGWWPKKKECTGERMLVNPYNGCSINCLFCYTKGFSFNYSRLFLEKKVATVWEDFDQVVANQPDSIGGCLLWLSFTCNRSLPTLER